MKRYERYKDSGVEWLGEVPEHWELIPNKYIFHLKKNVVGKNSSQYKLLSLTLNGVIIRDMENPQGKFPAEFDTYQQVNNGDFVFCHFDVEETPRTVGLSAHNGMITGAYTVYSVQSSYNKEFLYFFYLNLDYNKQLNPLYKGLRNIISKEVFGGFKTYVPPLKEQERIAEFLDGKCGKIDRAVAQKERMIELLGERRQIITASAVTRGLNPDIPLRDSGIDWIGSIPTHWQIKKMSHIYSCIGSGTTPNSSNESYYDGNINWLQTGDLTDGIIRSTSKSINEWAYRVHSALKVYKKNSLVIAMYGATIGKLGILDIPCCTNQACCVLSKSDIAVTKFVFYWLLAMRTNIIAMSYGGGQPNINQNIVKSLRVSLPPLDEQQAIADYLDRVNQKTERAISLKHAEIDRLKEYRQTLIDSAVTGKIKIE